MNRLLLTATLFACALLLLMHKSRQEAAACQSTGCDIECKATHGWCLGGDGYVYRIGMALQNVAYDSYCVRNGGGTKATVKTVRVIKYPNCNKSCKLDPDTTGGPSGATQELDPQNLSTECVSGS